MSAAYRKRLKDAEVRALVEGFHFEAYADVLLGELSTGNQKKAFLITAFALGPELLLMDEPANGLDFQSTEFLYQQIAGYGKRGAVLFTSHILESITLTADPVSYTHLASSMKSGLRCGPFSRRRELPYCWMRPPASMRKAFRDRRFYGDSICFFLFWQQPS